MAGREMSGYPRYFTLAEASALLPDVRERLEQIKRLRAGLRELGRKLETAARGNGDAAASQEHFGKLVKDLEAAVTELHDRGIVLRDLDTGLIDFPSLREGQEIFLCYLLGEDQIGFWHGIDEGYAARKPL